MLLWDYSNSKVSTNRLPTSQYQSELKITCITWYAHKEPTNQKACYKKENYYLIAKKKKKIMSIVNKKPTVKLLNTTTSPPKKIDNKLKIKKKNERNTKVCAIDRTYYPPHCVINRTY